MNIFEWFVSYVGEDLFSVITARKYIPYTGLIQLYTTFKSFITRVPGLNQRIKFVCVVCDAY